MTTRRVEAFSDGVFAIAITLLVLELGVPEDAGNDLAHRLGEQWPSYAAYLVSFFVIGIIWINHHAVFDHLIRADRGLLALNLVLLVFVVLIPWPTDLIATYLREGGSAARTAALVYSGAMTGMGFAFGALWRYASRPGGGLLDPRITEEQVRVRTRHFTAGAPIYAVSAVVALFSAPACLAINALLAVFYSAPWGGLMALPEAE